AAGRGFGHHDGLAAALEQKARLLGARQQILHWRQSPCWLTLARNEGACASAHHAGGTSPCHIEVVCASCWASVSSRCSEFGAFHSPRPWRRPTRRQIRIVRSTTGQNS